MRGSLLRKEFRECRWRWIGAAIALLLTAISLPPMFGFLGALLGGVELPGFIGRSLTGQLEDYSTYLWMNWYGKNLFQIVLVVAAILGGSALPAERSRGSLDFLLSLPVSRGTVFWSKYAAGLLALWGLIAASTLLLIGPLSWASGYTPEFVHFLSALPINFAGAALLYGIAWRMGIVSREPLVSTVIGGGIGVGIILVGSLFPGLRTLSLAHHMAAAGSFQRGAVDWLAVAIILAIALVLAIWSARSFERARF